MQSTAIESRRRPVARNFGASRSTLDDSLAEQRIAVLVPCYNEAAAIGKVVRDFRAALPTAQIFVFDNNSTDNTSEVAEQAGAVVRRESHRGKGNVVRRMFSDIDADIYVLVDGDGTYHAPSAPEMIRRLREESLDMVVGCRRETQQEAYRRGHRFGNAMLTGFVGRLFGRAFADILSGYRVFSRRFVRSFPALSAGFEIETEMTVHALELRMPIAEIDTPYGAREEGSTSKLSTYRDGFRILRTILSLYRREYPARFFGIIAGLLAIVAIALAVPLVITYLHTGYVPRFPTAILCVGLMLSAGLALTCGLILDTVTHGRREIKRLIYLSLSTPVAFGEWR